MQRRAEPIRADHYHRLLYRGHPERGDARRYTAIDLIDGEALCQLLKEKGLGVRVREVRTEEVTVVPDFFAEI